MKNPLFFIVVNFILLRVFHVQSAPVKSGRVTYSKAVNFLENYGYIQKKGPSNLATLLDVSALENGIRKFQQMFNLQVTGRLDQTTSKWMAAPRCGNRDIKADPDHSARSKNIRVKRYNTDRKYYWSKNNLTFRLESYPTSGLSGATVRSIFKEAFNMWSRVTNLDFREEFNGDKEADIMIVFGAREHGDKLPFDGPGNVLAHAYSPHPQDTYSRLGDAHFDDDEHWTDDMDKGKNLLAVAVHELGHSLGLDHSEVQSAIMFPFYIPPNGVVKLDSDDIEGIQVIYGPPPPHKVIPPEPTRRPELPPAPPKPTEPQRKEPKIGLDVCNAQIDVVLLVRGLELYVFSDEWQWRVGWTRTYNDRLLYDLHDGPHLYGDYWPVLPDNLGKIDAALERNGGQFYMFKRRRFWLLENNVIFAPGFTSEGRPLTDLGLPDNLDSIDTMFRWGHNGKVYIFAGDLYWRFEESSGHLGIGHVVKTPKYPRQIKDVWRGVPTPVDSAYTGFNGITYFFKGKEYYAFNNLGMTVERGFPRPASLTWLGCPEKRIQDVRETLNSPSASFVSGQRSEASSGKHLHNTYFILLFVCIHCVCKFLLKF